eukprot:m.44644 g.44644  ORF g.44644 m.44644 type:complete len:967 (+) comp33540_c0_seq1:102-3002(+)
MSFCKSFELEAPFLLFLAVAVTLTNGDFSQCNVEKYGGDTFKYVENNTVVIIAENFHLNPLTMAGLVPLIPPDQDLLLDVNSLVVEGHMKWNARNVEIRAITLTVRGKQATIDNSRQTPGSPDWGREKPTSKCIICSCPGPNGHKGGPGGKGGTIDLYVTVFEGEKLNVIANGGRGGKGQDGADGHFGCPAFPNLNLTACCYNQSTEGSSGKFGGWGGKAAKSGDGGQGGTVNIHVRNESHEEIWNHLNISVDGGQPGEKAEPGKAAPGGFGGLGAPTLCVNFPFPHCIGQLGKTGKRGIPGKVIGPQPGNAAEGKEGTINTIALNANDSAVLENFERELQIANDAYKSGHCTKALQLYRHVMHANARVEKAKLSAMKRIASYYVQQIQKQLNFWGFLLNHAPHLSEEGVSKNLQTDMLPYVENFNVAFKNSRKNSVSQNDFAQTALHASNFLVDLSSQKIAEGNSSLTRVKDEVQQLEDMQKSALLSLQASSKECAKALRHRAVGQRGMNVNEASRTIFSAIKISSSANEMADVPANKSSKEFDKVQWEEDMDILADALQNSGDKGTKKKAINDLLQDIEELKHVQNWTDAKNIVDKASFQEVLESVFPSPECIRARKDVTMLTDVSSALEQKRKQIEAVSLRLKNLNARVGWQKSRADEIRAQPSKTDAVHGVKYDLNEAVIEELAKLQQAHNYEVLAGDQFSIDSADFDKIKEKMVTDDIEKQVVSSSLAQEIQEFNKNVPPLANTIVLKRDELPTAFDQLDKTGQMPFSITGDEYVLAPLSHIKMTDVKVWLPGITTSANQIRVWLKRFGASRVYDRKGQQWSFTHEAKTMLFEYDKETLLGNTAAYKLTSEYMAVSPIGVWLLSVNKKYNPDVDTRDVTEIHVQLSGRFLPCEKPVCTSRKAQPVVDNSIDLSAANSDSGAGNTGVVIGVVVGGVIGIVLLFALAYVITKRKPGRRDYRRI